ncbi:hypothetical protein BDR03DRAFT_954831 [Suillus americanus]|nr:hypothetical protein BDR03DRAFT_954831 [Suillus americanus]
MYLRSSRSLASISGVRVMTMPRRADAVGTAAVICRRAMETSTSDKSPFMIARCHGEVIVEALLGC